MKNLVKYIATNNNFSQLKTLSSREMINLMILADSYDYKELRKNCGGFICLMVKGFQDWKLGLVVLSELKGQTIPDLSLSYNDLVPAVMEDMEDVIKWEGWPRLPRHFVEDLLKKRCLKASEGSLIRGAAEWCRAQPQVEPLSLFKDKFLPLLRLEQMTRPDYESNVDPIELFPEDFKTALLSGCTTDVAQLDPYKVNRGELGGIHVLAYSFTGSEIQLAREAGSFKRNRVNDAYDLRIELTKLSETGRHYCGSAVKSEKFLLSAWLKNLRPVNHAVVAWGMKGGAGLHVAKWTDGDNFWSTEFNVFNLEDYIFGSSCVFVILNDTESLEAEHWTDTSLIGHNLLQKSVEQSVFTVSHKKPSKFKVSHHSNKFWHIATVLHTKDLTFSGGFQVIKKFGFSYEI